MDSITQILLGASVSVAAMGKRTALWKAALWGGLAGLLPDLDVLIEHGDPILNMVRHRAESHSLLLLPFLAFAMAWLVCKVHGEFKLYARWCWALMLALVTHPLLDLMTIYGTQVFQPISDQAFGLGSIFIVDPLYTLPLLIAVVMTLSIKKTKPRQVKSAVDLRRSADVSATDTGANSAAIDGQAAVEAALSSDTAVRRALRVNAWALIFTTAYLVWTVLAQVWVKQHVRTSLQAQGLPSQHFFVTPSPLNTLLWRAVVISDTHYHEGFYSFFDRPGLVKFIAYDRGAELQKQNANHPQLERLARFTDGFLSVKEINHRLVLTDLRMGQEPYYIFAFDIGPALLPGQSHPVAVQKDRQIDKNSLSWLWHRIRGHEYPIKDQTR